MSIDGLLEQTRQSMVTAPLTCALVFAIAAGLTPLETGAAWCVDRQVAPCLVPWSSLTAHGKSELDNEIEIPDEPEDDDPDDPGFAFQDEGRFTHVLSFDSASGTTRPAPQAPQMASHVLENTIAGPERPRFLRLCRFLI
jgi:hypothetical protein